MTTNYSFSPGKRNLLSLFSVTLILVFINTLVFLVLSFFPSSFLIDYIAISLNNIQELRFWTFLTSMFMHGGLLHLFANMLSLIFIGGLVEKIIGPK